MALWILRKTIEVDLPKALAMLLMEYPMRLSLMYADASLLRRLILKQLAPPELVQQLAFSGLWLVVLEGHDAQKSVLSTDSIGAQGSLANGTQKEFASCHDNNRSSYRSLFLRVLCRQIVGTLFENPRSESRTRPKPNGSGASK